MEDGRGTILATAADADDPPRIRVEFFGLARQRAGVPSCVIQARRLAELLVAIGKRYPGLADLPACLRGSESPFRISLAGQRFVSADEALPPDAQVLILAADAGG